MRVCWTKKAKKNLEYIEEYIAQDNPHAAIETIFTIIHAVETLSDHPYIGRLGRIYGTRELIISDIPYIVPYRVKAKNIDILRVLHSAMRWPTSL